MTPREPVHPTLPETIRAHAARQPDRRACVILDLHGREAESVTYRELDRRARSTAAALLGVAEPGERALLMCATGLEFVVGFLGCLYAGIVAVPVPKPERLSAGPRHWARIAGIADDAEPAVLLTTADALAADEIGRFDVRERLAVPDIWSGHDGRCANPGTKAPAFLQYTSGSTGDPKGAIISQGAVAANLWAITEAFQLADEGADLAVVSWLPLYHDMGLMQLVTAIGNGGTSVLMSQMAFLLKPLTWLGAMDRHGAQLCSAPNFAYDLCVDRVTTRQRRELDLSNLRHVTCGSEPVRFDTAERFVTTYAEARLKPDVFKPAYGLAEATLYVSGERQPGDARSLSVDAAALDDLGRVVPPADSARSRRMVACGRAARNLDIRVVDPDTGQECPPDRLGELWIAGSSVADGYWRRSRLSADRFGGRIDGVATGPYLRTGDLGFLRDGQVYVAGRRDDLIIVDGRKHHPHDVESTVTESHSALATGQTVVVGYEENGRTLVAALAETALGVRVGSAQAPPAAVARVDVERAVRRAVNEEHQLGVAAVVLLTPGALPRTTSGKLQRKASRQLFLDGALNTW